MKIKNLKINKALLSSISAATIVLGIYGGAAVYYQYDNQQQICEKNINSNDIFMNENGEFCLRFEPGEHIIKISSNDALYHKIEAVEGYTISEVEINGWRDNNKAVYVNTEPVIVIATLDKNGKLEFNNFGEVVVEQSIKKK